MRFPPNPYAIAERLTKRPLSNVDGMTSERGLQVAFITQRSQSVLERLNRKSATVDDAVRLFAQIAALSNKSITFEQAFRLPLVKAASEAYGAEAIQQLLPFLIPISDAQFAVVEAPPAPPGITLNDSYADTGDLLVNDASYLDPQQGLLGDCYLIAAMIALAWTARPRLVDKLTGSGYRPPQDRDFSWQFHTAIQPQPTKVAGRVIVLNGVPTYARSEPSGEFWPSLLEKAYVVRAMLAQNPPVQREPESDDYQLISESEKPWRACHQLAGGVLGFDRHGSNLCRALLSRPEFLDAQGKITLPVTVMSRGQIRGYDSTWRAAGLIKDHAYAVLGKMPQSGHVVLRNPQGRSTTPRDGCFAGPIWDCGELSPVQINKAGVIAIEPALFNKCFELAGWVSL